MQEVGIKQNSNRIVGISSSKYSMLLSDIADLSSLKKRKEEKNETNVADSEKSSASTDEYIKNLLEFTNLKPKKIVIVENESMNVSAASATKHRTFFGDANCAVGYSDIMSACASDNLDWND